MAGLISLRGDGPWRGRSTRQIGDRGAKYQVRVVNGYVSSDGHELRSFPGYRTLADLSAVNNPTYGFRRLMLDAVKPVTTFDAAVGGTLYNYDFNGTDITPAAQSTLKCKADEAHIHAFEQVRGNLVLIGESLHRKTPIYTSARAEITVTAVAINSGLNWVLSLSGNPTTGYTSTDASTGMHGKRVGDIVFVENVEITAAVPTVTQANVDAHLNGRFHRVKVLSSGSMTLDSSYPSAADSGSASSATGEVYGTRSNASGTYPTPNPISPFEPSIYHRIDDPMALTTWTVRESLSLSDPASRKCTPAWVANRQRDVDDAMGADHHDGVLLPGGSPAGPLQDWSRRRQRSLPFRVNPEVAGDRIVMAAPGYMCCFQAPLSIPIEPEGWPSPPGSWSESSGRGVLWFGNDIYDKPRCLGVPKAILIDSLAKNYISPVLRGSGVASPVQDTHPYNFLTYATFSPGGLSSSGFLVGTYKIAVSYVDEATGEEGLASEPVEIDIKNGLGMQLLIAHPGYVMPESLPRRINVYMAPPGTDAMGYYTSLYLENNQDGLGASSYSAKYGCAADVSPDVGTLWRYVSVPFLGSPVTNAIDYTRLAPQSGQQPRGAEAIRVIQGVLFTVGHSGTHGNDGEFVRITMSSDYSSSTLAYGCISPNEVQVRAFRSDLVAQSTPSSPDAATYTEGGFLVGGNRLPASYQGCEVFSKDLLQVPMQNFTIDVVKNNASINSTGNVLARDIAMWQRIRTVHDIRNRVGASDQTRHGREAFLRLPRGQVQWGDPGRIGAVSATSIQFLDAKKNDDGFAIGQLNGSAILCSKNETYSLSWFRTPAGTIPALVSLEHGCVATNSMVTFDGGCAWIGARGPVAMTGDGLSWIGEQLSDDFQGDAARYAFDGKGVMRHCWGAHDAARGLVMWGLVTTTSTHQLSYKGVSATYANHSNEARSRFPCDEVLIWSYRSNAFTTWRPPTGMEVLWMRPLQLGDGTTRMCFLAADHRIYALDDEWADVNEAPLVGIATNNGTSSTALTSSISWLDDSEGAGGAAGRANSTFARTGMSVVFQRNGEITAITTIASLNMTTQAITLTDACTWILGDTVTIGDRVPLIFQSCYVGETLDVMRVKNPTLRYSTIGTGNAYAHVTMASTNAQDVSPNTSYFVDNTLDYVPLVAGTPTTQFNRVPQRLSLEQGAAEGTELSLTATIRGSAGIRITDILLETA